MAEAVQFHKFEAAKRASAQEIASLTSELEEVKKVAEERQEALTSLSTAYNGLEAEVYRLETEANGLREKLHASSEFGGGAAPETAAMAERETPSSTGSMAQASP